ncbi:hypothetical protein ES703_83387 [subsurface metagenome]
MAWWDKTGLGPRLERPAQVYGAGVLAMFTAVGDIFLTAIDGIVVAFAIAVGAGDCSLEVDAVPFATIIDISSDPVGQRYSVATAGGALDIGGAPVPCLTQPILIPNGSTIDCRVVASTTTGTILWGINYLPAEPGAYVTLA